MSLRAPIERPSILWRIFVVVGVGTLKVLSIYDPAWEWWEKNVTTAIPRRTIRALLAGTIALHVLEARAACRIAREAHVDYAPARVFSTLLWGFPSYVATKRAAEGAYESGAG